MLKIKTFNFGKKKCRSLYSHQDDYNQSTINMKLRYLYKIFELFLICCLNSYKF